MNEKQTIEKMLGEYQDSVINLTNKKSELKNQFLIQITEALYFDGTAQPKTLMNAKGYDNAVTAMEVAKMYKWVDGKGNNINNNIKIVTTEQAFRPLLQDSKKVIDNCKDLLKSFA